MPVWTDDGGHAWPETAAYARCACCGDLQPRSAFEPLGVIDRGAFEYAIRLVALGDAPLRIMQHLRGKFGWTFAELKSRLSDLPIDLPPIRREEDAIAFHGALLRDGARCEMRACTLEATDPPERLNAPWLLTPHHPSELADRIPHVDAGELGFRLSLYRLSNDPYRDPEKAWIGHGARTPFEIENVHALLGLLDMRDEAHWLLRANIARESGDFAMATDLLLQRTPAQHLAWHRALQTLVADRVQRATNFSPLDVGEEKQGSE